MNIVNYIKTFLGREAVSTLMPRMMTLGLIFSRH
jgi:hypothetical protein